MITINLLQDDTKFENYKSWWDNFDKYHYDIWSGDDNWSDYVNNVLSGIAKLNYIDDEISFYTEEDMIKFLLEWS